MIAFLSFQRKVSQIIEDISRKRNYDTKKMAMAEDSTCGDVSEEAARNAIINAQISRLDADNLINTAWRSSQLRKLTTRVLEG